eukprot:942126-Prymnesium_polylepis.2
MAASPPSRHGGGRRGGLPRSASRASLLTLGDGARPVASSRHGDVHALSAGHVWQHAGRGKASVHCGCAACVLKLLTAILGSFGW